MQAVLQADHAWLNAIEPLKNWLLTSVLASIRFGMVLWTTPIAHALSVPNTAKVGLTLALGTVASSAFGAQLSAGWVGASAGQLAQLVLTEMVNGFLLAMGVQLVFGAFAVAGRVVDTQIGFGVAQMLDPQTKRQVPILTGAMTFFGAALFFWSDAHLTLLRGLALSYEIAPVGSALGAETDLVRWFGMQATAMFTLGMALLAPVVVGLFLVELALGVVSRALPQMNVFMLGMPIKALVGLLLLGLWVSSMGEPMLRVYKVVFQSWAGLMHHG